MLTLTIIQILQVLLNVLWWVIIIQFVLSMLIVFNVINTSSPFIRSLHDGLDRLTEPLYRPIRRMLPNTGGIDFAPMIVLVAMAILNIILNNVGAAMLSSGSAI